jgi:hypothetical protein
MQQGAEPKTIETSARIPTGSHHRDGMTIQDWPLQDWPFKEPGDQRKEQTQSNL